MLARRVAAVLATAGCLLAGAGVAQAAPGDLDSTFGDGGIARVNLGLREFANGVAIQRDGKLVLGGTQLNSATFTSALLAARLTPTGALDTGFGQGTGFRTIGTNDTGEALVLQPDGQILVTGSVTSGSDADMLVAGFSGSDGQLDPAFASGTGIAIPHYAGSDYARAIALAPNGKIMLGGHTAGSGYNILFAARLNVPDGTKDLTYGSNGVEAGDADELTNGEAIGLTPDGATVVAGSWSASIGGQTQFELARFDATQSVSTHFSSLPGAAQALAIQPDGKVLVAGYSGSPTDLVVARLSTRATSISLDSSFGDRGVERINLGDSDVANAIALQPDGKIVVAGTTASGSTSQAVAVRLQPNGLPDTTFGHNGSAVIPFPGGGRQAINAMALRSDGTIVLAGSATSPGSSASQDLLVMRLEGDNGPGGGNDGGGGSGGGPGNGSGGPGGGGSGVAPRCEGRKATIVGTRRADRLKGTRRADVIVALGGNDRIDGKGGNDLICAGDGNDVAGGGAGNDRVDGGNGKDTLTGGAGKDLLAGQGGKDHLLGGPGADTLRGGAGSDVLLGGRGSNMLRQ